MFQLDGFFPVRGFHVNCEKQYFLAAVGLLWVPSVSPLEPAVSQLEPQKLQKNSRLQPISSRCIRSVYGIMGSTTHKLDLNDSNNNNLIIFFDWISYSWMCTGFLLESHKLDCIFPKEHEYNLKLHILPTWQQIKPRQSKLHIWYN